MHYLDAGKELKSKVESEDSRHPDKDKCKKESDEVVAAVKAIKSGEDPNRPRDPHGPGMDEEYYDPDLGGRRR